jgi:DNA-binding response OmpR family regulator
MTPGLPSPDERGAADRAPPDSMPSSEMASDRRRAAAFDVDPESLSSLRAGLPGWEVETLTGSSTTTLEKGWNPDAVDLLVIGAGGSPALVLGLCRGLRSQVGRAHTPLLVLVLPGQEVLSAAALEAGADACLLRPIHPKEVAALVARAQDGGQPGRHTLGLDRAQPQNRWQDDGGEA